MHKTLLISTGTLQNSSQENQGQRKIKMAYHMNSSYSKAGSPSFSILVYAAADGNPPPPPPRIFQTFGGFTSGIGICYTDSLITNTQHQSYAKNLVIGQRILPQVFLRAADCRPFEIQDLLPSDARFKIILFIGDTSDSRQLGIINDLANELEGILGKLAPLGHIFTMFDILAICSDTKTSIRLGCKKLPLLLRSHWSR